MSLGGMSASFNTSFSDITGAASAIAGSQGTRKTRGSTSEAESGTKSNLGVRQLQLDPAALSKIISDVLGAEQGMSAIFSQEKGAGLYDSTVSANAMGDLTAKLVGEIAKITGREVTAEQGTTSNKKATTSAETVTNQSKGLLDQISQNIADDDPFGIVGAVLDLRGKRRQTPPGEEKNASVDMFPTPKGNRERTDVDWNPYV